MELQVNSTFSAERRVRAWVNGGGTTNNFILPINTTGRAQSGNDWAVVFGPMGNAVEDHIDYGDAPDSYKTLLASDGPRYKNGTIMMLGTRWDAEPDGQPTSLANGDDANLWGYGGPDDEDGVVFGPNYVIVTVTSTVATGFDAQLRAWWDTNENGLFDHPGELYIDDLGLGWVGGAGTFSQQYNLGFDPRFFYSRFRLTLTANPFFGNLGDITPWGEFIGVEVESIGEVEDYAPAPEPSTFMLASAGLGALGLLAWRRRKAYCH
jgi:hypothetical protein